MLDLGSEPFCTGRATYFEEARGFEDEGSRKLFIRVEFPDIDWVTLAQVDTGSPWTMVPRDVAEALGLFGRDGERISLSTRFGTLRGTLERVSLTLLSDEGEGRSLHVETVVCACDWPEGKVMLGHGGLLANIRFAVDPSARHFYFGPTP